MGYDHGDSSPFDFEPNGFPFGLKSKGKLTPRSYPIQYERKWKYSFLSAIMCGVSTAIRRRAAWGASASRHRGVIFKRAFKRSRQYGTEGFKVGPSILISLWPKKKSALMNQNCYEWQLLSFFTIEWQLSGLPCQAGLWQIGAARQWSIDSGTLCQIMSRKRHIAILVNFSHADKSFRNLIESNRNEIV